MKGSKRFEGQPMPWDWLKAVPEMKREQNLEMLGSVLNPVFEIGIIEDAECTIERLRWILSHEFPGVKIRCFDNELSLECAWQTGYRPDAMIIDLLVPERYVLQNQWFLTRRSVVGNVARVLLYPFRNVFPLLKVKPYPGKRTQEQTPDGQYRQDYLYWGGVEFLRFRAALGDQDQVRFYIYSWAVAEGRDTEWDCYPSKLQKAFRQRCGEMVHYIEMELLFQIDAQVYEKRYKSVGPGQLEEDPRDQFKSLVQQMHQDFPGADHSRLAVVKSGA